MVLSKEERAFIAGQQQQIDDQYAAVERNAALLRSQRGPPSGAPTVSVDRRLRTIGADVTRQGGRYHEHPLELGVTQVPHKEVNHQWSSVHCFGPTYLNQGHPLSTPTHPTELQHSKGQIQEVYLESKIIEEVDQTTHNTGSRRPSSPSSPQDPTELEISMLGEQVLA
jgi:hypothetical protein